jgi:NhaP-type Na+/H+ or K+/H+ antiporter
MQIKRYWFIIAIISILTFIGFLSIEKVLAIGETSFDSEIELVQDLQHSEENQSKYGESHAAESHVGHAEEHSVVDEHHEGGGGHHGPDTSPLFFIIIAVFIGAATRHFLKAIPVPFTALLLIIGIVLGVMTRFHLFESWVGFDVSFISDSLKWAAHIDPHMLFFVFLPILIFEAAFAMDLHTFKKSATNSVILAVPGILVALLLTGAMVYAIDYLNIGLEGWANWSLAFMFGSVISATDPVAVVALLKDLGASKKLGTLIEGESLLNDGTAIVLFMVFFLGLSGQASDANGFLEFFRVALGGIGVGLFVGWITLRWLKKVFNDAMIEISAVVAAAYFTFYVAEHFMHVSGVLALVALGLMVGGFGRSSISPQVEHFMHEFWELAGFIANCLIFLIVGLVIAERTEFSANDFMVLGIVYVGIHVVRGIVMLTHYPFMKNAGYGLPVKDAIVVWFGALRGAIGLALALMVAGVDSNVMGEAMGVSAEAATQIKNQFLFIIAGTVTLTLLVNATTIKILIQKLGLLDIAPVKALAMKSTSEYMRSSAESHMIKLKEDRHLRRANWSTVAEYLPKELKLAEDIDEASMSVAKIAEHRRLILEKEKSAYWKQFKDGMLSASAVRTLTDTVNDILDDKGAQSLSHRKDLELLWQPPKWLSTLQSLPIIGKVTENAFFERLAVSSDCAVGFIAAQEECLKLLESMYRAEDKSERPNLELIEQEVNENIISGQTFVRNLRNTYPEIYRSIATRQAIRSVLNYEMHTVSRLRGKGRLDGSEAAKLTHEIEARMKQLLEKPPSIELPETGELLEAVSWVKGLDKDLVKKLKMLCQTKIYSNGQVIMKAKSSTQGMFIIARGNVKILEGTELLELIGKGHVLGQKSILGNRATRCSGVCETPVTALWLSRGNVVKLLDESPAFKAMMEKLQ